MKTYLLYSETPGYGAVIELRGIFETKKLLDIARQNIMDTEPCFIEAAKEWLDKVKELYAQGYARGNTAEERSHTPEEHCKVNYLISVELELNEPVTIELFGE